MLTNDNKRDLKMKYIKSIMRSSVGKLLYAFLALIIATIVITILILFA